MITVACVWVQANVAYGLEYVTRLREMVDRHLHERHEFACLTDRPWLVPEGIRAIPVWHDAALPGWWAKIRLFDPSLFPPGRRVLYLDLDSIVVDNLRPIVDYAEVGLALVPHEGTFTGRHGKAVVRRFNSSVMALTAGKCPELYTKWSPLVASRLWGDQDWIGEQHPSARAMPIEWFPRISKLAGQVPMAPAKVVLCKSPKNEEAAKRWPWVDQAWRSA
jgi:hypothetical protein